MKRTFEVDASLLVDAESLEEAGDALDSLPDHLRLESALVRELTDEETAAAATLPEHLSGVHLIRDEDTHLPAVMAETLGISRSEGRRLIAQGGVELNGVRVDDADVSTAPGDIVRVGKRLNFTIDADTPTCNECGYEYGSNETCAECSEARNL